MRTWGKGGYGEWEPVRRALWIKPLWSARRPEEAVSFSPQGSSSVAQGNALGWG